MNAPSREAIYRQVMSLSEGAGWVYEYEDFVTFDEYYRNLVKSSRWMAPRKNAFETDRPEVKWKHVAPILGGKSIKESSLKLRDIEDLVRNTTLCSDEMIVSTMELF